MSSFCNIYIIDLKSCQAFRRDYGGKCEKSGPDFAKSGPLAAQNAPNCFKSMSESQITRSTGGWFSPVSQFMSSVSQSMISSWRVSHATVAACSSGVGSWSKDFTSSQ